MTAELVLAAAIAVTNHAHCVISGEFGGVTNNSFIVSGRTYPLSILPKSEIRRVKGLAGLDVRTERQKRTDRARQLRLERIRIREEEGEIMSEEARSLRKQED